MAPNLTPAQLSSARLGSAQIPSFAATIGFGSAKVVVEPAAFFLLFGESPPDDDDGDDKDEDEDGSGEDRLEVTLTGSGSPELILKGKFSRAREPRIL